MLFVHSIVLSSLILSAYSLVTPHHILDVHRRHAILPRAVPDPVAVAPISKRSLNKRCKNRSPPMSTSTTPAPAAAAKTGPPASAGSSSHATSSTVESTTSTPPSPAAAVNTGHPAGSDTDTSSDTSSNTASPTTHETPTTTSSAPQSTAGLPSYMIGTQYGQGTWYETGLGACGTTNNDSQHICAMSHLLFDSFPGYDGVNPNTNPICGRQITVSYQGKSVSLTIMDRCVGCQETDVDMSPSAFSTLANPSVGRMGISWVWNN